VRFPRAILWLAALSLLAGCATDRESMALAEAAAAQYMGCPHESLHVEPIGSAAFRVDGCGKSAFYRCVSSYQPRRRCCRPVATEQEASSWTSVDESSPDRVCRETPGEVDSRREALTSPTP
jgi:hypothetical protein